MNKNNQGAIPLIYIIVAAVAVLGVAGVAFVSFTPAEPKVVSPSPEPVGRCVPAGCSGQVCAEESEAGEIITTCEYRPEYACYRESRCERQPNGRCGWTETPGMRACLNSSSSVTL